MQQLAHAAGQIGAHITAAPEPSEMERVLARFTNLVIDAGQIAGDLAAIVTRSGASYATPSEDAAIGDGQHPGTLQRLHSLLDRLELAQRAQTREVGALNRFF